MGEHVVAVLEEPGTEEVVVVDLVVDVLEEAVEELEEGMVVTCTGTGTRPISGSSSSFTFELILHFISLFMLLKVV